MTHAHWIHASDALYSCGEHFKCLELRSIAANVLLPLCPISRALIFMGGTTVERMHRYRNEMNERGTEKGGGWNPK